MMVHGHRTIWGHSGPVDAVESFDLSLGLRLALPLLVVAVLGLWTPGPLAAALDSIRTILGGAGV
jgi:hypothetical protein